MDLLLTAVCENGFCELYLPNANNRTVPLDIKPSISGYQSDITLPLEVWDEIWVLKPSSQFVTTINEEPVNEVVLKPGLLMNCVIAGTEDVFSLTVNEVDDGNTKFAKYFINPKSTPHIGIGSGEGNLLLYKNRFVSPKHAQISFRGDEALIKDLKSVNGTFVNGRLLEGERALQYGDVIYIIGLKIVYLGNVLAINNPKGEAEVKGMKHIEISAATEAEENEAVYDADESYFLRTPRRLQALDTTAFTVEKCPPRQKQKRQPLVFTIGPAFTMVIPMAVGAMMSSGSGGFGAAGLVMSVGAAAIGTVWSLMNVQYQKKEETANEEKRVNLYTSYLAKIAEKIDEKMQLNRSALQEQYASSREMTGFALTGNHRLWEKSVTHDDFLSVRVGTGDIPSPNKIEVPKEQAMAEYDPLNDKAEEIRTGMSALQSVPVALSLYERRIIGVVSSDRSRAINLSNLISAQICGAHPYTDVRMCYVYGSVEEDAWEYARFLPHVWTPDGKLRMLCTDFQSVGDVMFYLSGVLRERLENAEGRKKEDDAKKVLPHYVVVIGDRSLIEEEAIAKYLFNPAPELGLTVILLEDSVDKLPSSCTTIIQDDNEFSGFYSTTNQFEERSGVEIERLSTEQMNAFARALSNYRVREMNVSTAIPELLTFLDMYRTSKVEDLGMLHKWLENRTYESMRSMVGYKSGNQPLYLDIHEKYHGPHGLVAGTTGSGKSETLQSYILSLVVNYHPHEVAFILIDYKGGGMAQSFIGLPHLSGVITNLGGNATNRALLSINAEIKNRQRIFNEYKVKHIDAYIELYRSGVAAEPMPHLLIIADEFAELKKEQPEFVRALVSAARVGRSLGVNLILATQKPSGVVDDEIWSNTRFRLCLRVADKQDSAEMLKRPDAAFITGTGRGFFQVGNDEIFEEFQSGWSGAEYEPEAPFSDDKNKKVEMLTLVGKNAVPKKKKQKKSDNIAKVTQLDAVVRYAAKIAEENKIPPIKQIWLPPLKDKVYLEELDVAGKPEGFSLLLPVGMADNPQTQSQYPVYTDFLRDGNLLVCGTAGSGKTTLLQTLLYGAVTKYTAAEVNAYILDFSSRTMAVFSGLPHVGGVMFEGDDDKIQDTFDLLQKTLARRKSEFSGQGIGSFKEYVSQKTDCSAILLFIDNFVAFNESYDRYDDVLAQLAREGASYGIYLVIACNNAGEMRSRLRQSFTSGVALQMQDRYEYESVIGERTEILPEGRTAGRGLIKAPHPLEFQVALPIREKEGASLAQTLRQVFAKRQPDDGAAGAKKVGETVEMPDTKAFLARKDVDGMSANLLPLGLDLEENEVVFADMDQEFLYIVGGVPGTGKTNFLCNAALRVKQRGGQVLLFDNPQNELQAFAKAQGLDGYASTMEDLFSMLEDRLLPVFLERNGIVADARDAGKDPITALKGAQHVLFLINDIEHFLSCVYDEKSDLKDFVEVLFEKGRQHRMLFLAAITPDNYIDLARYAALRSYVGYGRGLHLGGMMDQQSMLQFNMSAADNVRQLQTGTGWALDVEGRARRVTIPLHKEEEDQ
ncbi:type VII secretion protein EssC [Christensenellaceae bacterium OttesenSCG-928-M15]|nr:type VII secretion protein EssC [Christensenellaceae bacterium OttesenSCG-928-M15]